MNPPSFPWRALMHWAFTTAGWRPDDFWRASLREVLALLPAEHHQPMPRAELDALRRRFPDEYPNE